MEKIILPRLINNAFVKSRPDIIFLHGYDVQGKGAFGQAAIYNNENTFPIPTMYKFCASGARYFTDGDSHAWEHIAHALSLVPDDGRPIIPLRKIGEGCSRMSELAPKLFKDLQVILRGLEYKNYEWDYNLTYGIQY